MDHTQKSLALTQKQIEYRRRQIQLAKQDIDYEFISQKVNKRYHPPVPSATNAKMSLRAFRGSVTAWRKRFHALANAERQRLGLPPNTRSKFHYPIIAP